MVQWVAETWSAAMHLLSDCGSCCWLPLFSLFWSFHGEKLSSGNRMSVLDTGWCSVRFPSDQKTEAGHLCNLALSRAKIEQTDVQTVNKNPTLSLTYPCVLNTAWWWMLRGSPMEAHSQFPAQFWSKGSGLRPLRMVCQGGKAVQASLQAQLH